MAQAAKQAAKKTAGTSSASRKRRARGSLSEAEILAAARELVDSEGLHQLSFPKLAKRLNAGATSLYWYFHTKDDLLAALIDEITREMYLSLEPVGDGPWDLEIVEYHVGFRRVLEDSPVYRDVFSYRAQTLFLQSRMAPFLLRSIETDLAMFVRAGLTPDQAAHAFNAFSLFTRAFVIVEQGIENEEVDEESFRLINFALSQVAADLPAVAALDSIEQMMGLNEELFRMGLRVLVAGLRKRYPVLAKLKSARKR